MNSLEKSVLGIIFDSDPLDKIEDLIHLGLDGNCFPTHACRIVWGVVKGLIESESFTPQKIESFILESSEIDKEHTIRVSMLSDLIQSSGPFTFVKSNALTLIENHLRQEAQEHFEAAKLNAETAKADDILTDMERRLMLLREKAYHGNQDERLEAVVELTEELDSIERGEKGTYRSSGFDLFDECVGGLPPGKLIIIAGRPGCAKTSLVEQILAKQVKQRIPISYFQMELGKTRALGRICAKICDVEWWKFEKHDKRFLTPDEMVKFKLAFWDSKNWPLEIHTATGMDSWTLRAQVNHDIRKSGTQIAVFDHLQLVDVPRGGERRNAIGEMTRTLKRLAVQNNLTCIALSQLGREIDNGVEPLMRHLKESGDIEQDADIILALWQKEGARSDNTTEWFIEWKILKNRDNGYGQFSALFNGPKMEFKGKLDDVFTEKIPF